MDYLPTLGEKWPHSRGNVGKYSLHGSYGISSPGPSFCHTRYHRQFRWYIGVVRRRADLPRRDFGSLGESQLRDAAGGPLPRGRVPVGAGEDVLLTGS